LFQNIPHILIASISDSVHLIHEIPRNPPEFRGIPSNNLGDGISAIGSLEFQKIPVDSQAPANPLVRG
jgi:hypothetical protein